MCGAGEVCGRLSAMSGESREDRESPKAGVTGSCEPPAVGGGSQTSVSFI